MIKSEKDCKKIVKSTEGKRMKFGNYMIGSIAYHFSGDISRELGDINNKEDLIENLLYASEESGDYYIGAWVTGFGMVNVHFPKSTTRKLTKKEVKKINGRYNGFKRDATYLKIGSMVTRLEIEDKKLFL